MQEVTEFVALAVPRGVVIHAGGAWRTTTRYGGPSRLHLQQLLLDTRGGLTPHQQKCTSRPRWHRLFDSRRTVHMEFQEVPITSHLIYKYAHILRRWHIPSSTLYSTLYVPHKPRMKNPCPVQRNKTGILHSRFMRLLPTPYSSLYTQYLLDSPAGLESKSEGPL